MKIHQNLRAALMLGTAFLAIGTAHAQDVAGQQQSNSGRTDDDGSIVVTGSRITANGYEAPTPVTVVSTLELMKKAPESISAGLTQLPQFAMTAGTNVTSAQAGTPSAGNYLNLRRLGAIETLILFDGHRLPPTSFDGTVDTNIIPQSLIERVDVVTGGASAAYGSDAVTGVVNFILDKDFDGLKGTVQGGISSRNDNEQLKFNLAYGKDLFDNRVHVQFSYDHFFQPGIKSNADRPYGGELDGGWVMTGTGTATNPYTPNFNVKFGNATYGTLITSGRRGESTVAFTLKDYQFNPDGSIRPLIKGTPTGTSNYVVGGDGGVAFGATLTSRLRTDQGFGRAEFDLGNDVKAFVQGSFTSANTSYVTVAAGTQINAFQIFADNAFLPTAVRDAMIAENVTSFVGSRIEADQTPKRAYTENDALVVMAGINGKLGNYDWDVTYSHGDSTLKTRHSGNFDQSKWYAALDAVRGPNGNIVCRITITNPGLQDKCLPWNPFGNGAPSKASYAYFEEDSKYQVTNKQDDIAATISGDLFEMPAGTVKFATGAEWRRQTLEQTSNTDPSKPISLVGLRTNVSSFILQYNSTNVGKANGSQTVKEGFVEVAVPLLKDMPFFYALDVNAAARYTDYSTSGTAKTWKLGLSWSPIQQLRMRGTVSRDMRAPTLYELFAGASSTRGTFADIHTGGNLNVINFSRGNPDLKPEKGDTVTLGAIWQPDFFPGFSLSLDYYNIKIRDQITRLNSTQINQQCETSNGTDVLCQYIVRPLPFSDRTIANFPLTITAVPFNQASLRTHGFDYEVNYRLPIGTLFTGEDARLDLRLIGNYTPKLTAKAGATSIPVENAGLASWVPHHKINISTTLHDGPLSLGAEVKFLGQTKYTNVSTIYYADNTISPVAYVNLNASYDTTIDGKKVTFYGNISNLLDKHVFAAQTGQPTEFYPTFQSQFDVVGRYFVAGVRFQF